jgi:PAS domain S-box-containing protein
MPSHRRLPTRPRRAQKPTKLSGPKAFLANAGIGRTVHHYSPNQTIFSQGESADVLFFIQKGTVRLSVLSKQGKEATIALFGPGDFLGEGCIASGQPLRMATATAISSCSLLRIERREMLRALHEEHGLSDMFVAYMVGRNNRIEADLVDQRFNSSEERFRLVANTAPALIWMSGTDKQCTFFNRGWLDFTGQSMEHELGEGWASGVHPEDLAGCLRIYSGAFDARMDFEMEYRLRRFDGKYRWIVDYGVPRFESDGTFCGYIGSCVDISDRKLSEESLEELSGRLITAQEEERTRIARELHDDFSQRLALQGIGLAQLWKKLPESEVEGRARVQALMERTREISSDLHLLSHQLHSSKLEHVGLVPALIGLCEETSSKYGIQVEFTDRGVSSEIPKDVADRKSVV